MKGVKIMAEIAGHDAEIFESYADVLYDAIERMRLGTSTIEQEHDQLYQLTTRLRQQAARIRNNWIKEQV